MVYSESYDPKGIGDASTAAVLASLLRAGYSVSVPWGDNQPYDLIIDDGKKLSKVQCKTARASRNPGAVLFNAVSQWRSSRGRIVTRYDGKIDYFGVYDPNSGRSFLIPIADLGRQATVSLRIGEPKPQGRGLSERRIRYADVYEVRSIRV